MMVVSTSSGWVGFQRNGQWPSCWQVDSGRHP